MWVMEDECSVGAVCPFCRAGCGGRAGAGAYAWGVARADILGMPTRRTADQHVAPAREIFGASGIEHVRVAHALI